MTNDKVSIKEQAKRIWEEHKEKVEVIAVAIGATMLVYNCGKYVGTVETNNRWTAGLIEVLTTEDK